MLHKPLKTKTIGFIQRENIVLSDKYKVTANIIIQSKPLIITLFHVVLIIIFHICLNSFAFVSLGSSLLCKRQVNLTRSIIMRLLMNVYILQNICEHVSVL